MTSIGVDTSVAVPLLIAQHAAHMAVVRWWNGRELALSGHALAETYSVLTRLPGDLRMTPADAAHLLRTRFAAPLLLPNAASLTLIDALSQRDIAGGAVYDALVALAAAANDAVLATRDARARSTYDLIGVPVVVVHD